MSITISILITVLVIALVLYLVQKLPIDSTMKQMAQIVVVIVGIVSLLRSLGSGLIDQSQKMTVAAMQTAEKKVCAHRS